MAYASSPDAASPAYWTFAVNGSNTRSLNQCQRTSLGPCYVSGESRERQDFLKESLSTATARVDIDSTHGVRRSIYRRIKSSNGHWFEERLRVVRDKRQRGKSNGSIQSQCCRRQTPPIDARLCDSAREDQIKVPMGSLSASRVDIVSTLSMENREVPK